MMARKIRNTQMDEEDRLLSCVSVMIQNNLNIRQQFLPRPEFGDILIQINEMRGFFVLRISFQLIRTNSDYHQIIELPAITNPLFHGEFHHFSLNRHRFLCDALEQCFHPVR